MKRIISVALAVVMVLALSVSAFAAYEEPVEFGLYFGDPDNGGWGVAASTEVTGPGTYTITYEGDARNLQWIIVKNAAGETEPTSIPEGTVIRTTSITMDGVEATFDTGDSYDYTVGANGTVEIQYNNSYTGFAHITNMPASAGTIVVTFVVDPDNAAEETTPADDTADDETPSAPAESTDTETEPETPAETGIVLAVLPMAVAAAAVVVARKRK